MKKILGLLLIVLLSGCSLISTYEATYRVVGAGEADVSYISGSGDIINIHIVPPWEKDESFEIGEASGFSVLGTEEITASIEFMINNNYGYIKSVTSSDVILIYERPFTGE